MYFFEVSLLIDFSGFTFSPSRKVTAEPSGILSSKSGWSIICSTKSKAIDISRCICSLFVTFIHLTTKIMVYKIILEIYAVFKISVTTHDSQLKTHNSRLWLTPFPWCTFFEHSSNCFFPNY